MAWSGGCVRARGAACGQRACLGCVCGALGRTCQCAAHLSRHRAATERPVLGGTTITTTAAPAAQEVRRPPGRRGEAEVTVELPEEEEERSLEEPSEGEVAGTLVGEGGA